MLNLAPIVLFVYNRPKHTLRTLNALKKNKLAKDSIIFIFSDGAKKNEDETKVNEVREIISKLTGFKEITIYKSDTNNGLAKSVISGVTKIINEYNRVIVMEDDLITSKGFLSFMNNALDTYKNNRKIWSISGYNLPINIPENYNYDVYLSYRAHSWGWGTWKDRWDEIDWEIKDFNDFINSNSKQTSFNRGGRDMSRMLKKQMNGEIDSWAIRWCYNQFKEDSYTIYPVKSKVKNIGMDGSGVHCGASNKFDVSLDTEYSKNELPKKLELNQKILSNFKNYFEPKSIKEKIRELLIRIGLYS